MKITVKTPIERRPVPLHGDSKSSANGDFVIRRPAGGCTGGEQV